MHAFAVASNSKQDYKSLWKDRFHHIQSSLQEKSNDPIQRIGRRANKFYTLRMVIYGDTSTIKAHDLLT